MCSIAQLREVSFAHVFDLKYAYEKYIATVLEAFRYTFAKHPRVDLRDLDRDILIANGLSNQLDQLRVVQRQCLI